MCVCVCLGVRESESMCERDGEGYWFERREGQNDTSWGRDNFQVRSVEETNKYRKTHTLSHTLVQQKKKNKEKKAKQQKQLLLLPPPPPPKQGHGPHPPEQTNTQISQARQRQNKTANTHKMY